MFYLLVFVCIRNLFAFSIYTFLFRHTHCEHNEFIGLKYIKLREISIDLLLCASASTARDTSLNMLVALKYYTNKQNPTPQNRRRQLQRSHKPLLTEKTYRKWLCRIYMDCRYLWVSMDGVVASAVGCPSDVTYQHMVFFSAGNVQIVFCHYFAMNINKIVCIFGYKNTTEKHKY